MAKNLILIKIGGSVITDKSKKKGDFDKRAVSRIAREIAKAYKNKKFDLILVHGAGAYPHFLTSKYKIKEGYKNLKSAFGFAHIKNELFKLSNLVCNEFLKLKLPVSIFQPSASVKTRNGVIKKFDTAILQSMVKLGIIPILMGDDSIDEVRGIAVLSGDNTLSYLGRRLKSKKVIFISDVDGVYDKNPKMHRDAKIIKKISNKNFDEIIKKSDSFTKYDVSGEMRGKLIAIKRDLGGIEVRIVSGFKKNEVYRALMNEEVGTKLKFENI